MSQYLPFGGFKCSDLHKINLKRLSVNTIRKDSPEGCILEVVLKN